MFDKKLGKMEKIVDELVANFRMRLLQELGSKFTMIPETTCNCGKQVFFIFPHKKSVCSRCGCIHKLCVKVEKKVPETK